MPADTTGHGAATKPRKSVLKRLVKMALAIVLVITLASAWVIVSVLAAKPSIDPSIHAELVALSSNQQPDPNAPTRYPELIEAFERFEVALNEVADEFVREEGRYGDGLKFLDFSTVLRVPEPDEWGAQHHLDAAEDARRSVDAFIERELFDEVLELLQSPNVSKTYPEAFDVSGEPLAADDWFPANLYHFRQFANVVSGCARVLADRGELERASLLLEQCSSMPGVLTRFALVTEHYSGFAVSALIADRVQELAVNDELSPEALLALQRIQANLADPGDFGVTFQAETILNRDIHFRTHTASGRYIPSVAANMATSMMGIDLDVPPADQGFIAKVKDAYGYLLVRRDTSLDAITELHQRLQPTAQIDQPVEREAMLAEVDEALDSFGSRYPLLDGSRSYLTTTVRVSVSHRTRIAALGILLAMAEHRLDRGDWPTSLDQLVPDYLEAIPINPLTGSPFEYDHEPGEPPSLQRLGIGPEFPG